MISKIIYMQIIGIIITGIATAQEKPFTITGSIKGKTDGYIYMAYKGSA